MHVQNLLSQLICGDDTRAEAAARNLAALGQAGLPALLALANDADAEKRWWALRTLAEIDARAAAVQLSSALSDPDPTVRQCAALGLNRQPNPAAIPALLTLLGDGDRLTARLAGDALIAAGSPAVPGLVEVLSEGTQSAQIEAARALALIGDPAAIGPLFQAWQGDSIIIQHWAEQGLDRMGVGMQFFKPE
jgi:HEAT repeat protein